MPDVSFYMAFGAGLISFLSPCVLPLVPGYISFISGVSFAEIREKEGSMPFLNKEKRIILYSSIFFITGALLIGAAFAFGWTPCIGPILAGILTYAGTLEKVYQGVFLLLMYSLGLGIPFLLTAIGIDQFHRFFNRIKKYMRVLEVTSGIVMVILGLMIFTNKLILIPGLLPFLNKFAL